MHDHTLSKPKAHFFLFSDGDRSYNAYATFSEKLTFLPPNTRVRMLVFQKILRMY